MFKSDVNAIPDDKWTATFGGCTKPCSDIAADAIGFLFWATKAIEAGGTPTTPEGAVEKLAAACSTKAGANDALDMATQAMTAAITSASDETLQKTATAPWGMDAPLYSFAQMAISHLWYHDGQLNYVQCLLGDGDYHWTH
jgi:hypothetical protein